jgi:hypothetical protein
VGGGVGATFGAAAMFGLGFVGYRRRQRRSGEAGSSSNWTEADIARFREAYQKNHDFEVLCQAFPDKTRESVAVRARSMMNTNNPYFGRDSYIFVRTRVQNAWNKFYASQSYTQPMASGQVSGAQGYDNGMQSMVRVPMKSNNVSSYASGDRYSASKQYASNNVYATPGNSAGMVSPPPGFAFAAGNPQFAPGPSYGNRSMVSTVSY